jgi:hypothetical protein
MRKRDLCMVKGGMDFTDITWTSEYRHSMPYGHPMALSAEWFLRRLTPL